jgi:hypothetical protein
MYIPLVALCLILLLILSSVWSSRRKLARAEFIRSYAFPKGLMERLGKRRPELSLKDRQLVSRGLRQFFLAYLKGGRRFVSMPSQAADDLWHEFILYTRNYEDFCRKAFGGMLHHTPAVVLGAERRNNEGLRRVWWHACREENIDPRDPSRLPLLFALDTKLGIADGFRYAPDCRSIQTSAGVTVHCGGDFSSSDFDGSTDGFGDSGSGTGSGDGGDGGGGGCGGD